MVVVGDHVGGGWWWVTKHKVNTINRMWKWRQNNQLLSSNKQSLENKEPLNQIAVMTGSSYMFSGPILFCITFGTSGRRSSRSALGAPIFPFFPPLSSTFLILGVFGYKSLFSES